MIGGLLPETVAPVRDLDGVDPALPALRSLAERMVGRGLPVPTLQGKLLRPALALAMVPPSARHRLDDRFWSGALAIQTAHEASLLHDDVMDGAAQRRGRPTLAAARGTAAALVTGDHYLTASYRMAVETGSFEFVSRFAEAVERTVAGEIAQQSSAGHVLSLSRYDEIINGKSGELFGAAAALGGAVLRLGETELRHCLGCSFGNLYQRIDDLLDYCTGIGTGKPPLQDYRQEKWSWVMELAGVDAFGLPEREILHAVFERRRGRPSPARRALEILRDRQRLIVRHAPRVGVDEDALLGLLAQCVGAAERGVAAQERALSARATDPPAGPGRSTPPPAGGDGGSDDAFGSGEHDVDPQALEDVRRRALALGGPGRWAHYFGAHARTFSLAARLFPPREAALVSGLYAWCRFTDDMVDAPDDGAEPPVLARRLAAWRHLSLRAYDGEVTDIPLLDAVMVQAAERGVARLYPEALLEGVRMDLEPRDYESWAELEHYTFGVAGAVGGWMTQLFGLSDPDLLDQAHALGHGMQLTNIARDVGEDLARGRLYLPAELLLRHGLGREEIEAMARGEAPLSGSYRGAVGELIAHADAHYERAWPGIRALPLFFRRPVAAAASAYRGIHHEIRRNGYDNLSRRAHTSTARKVFLAGAGLLDAGRGS